MNFLNYENIDTKLQEFQSICPNCARNSEVRNFSLSKNFYTFSISKLNLKFYRRLKITCSNCNKSWYLPQEFAKKVFKNGLRVDLLMKFSKDPILSSWFLNFLSKFYMLFGALIIILAVTIGIRFYIEPVQLNEPKTVAFEELSGGNRIGEIVRIKGKVDYTLAFTKDEITSNQSGDTILSTREVYLPIFSENDPLTYIVIKGGRADLSNISSRIGVTNNDLLRNQNYEVVGRVERIENITNNELKEFYVNTLPRNRSLNNPKLIINSAEVVNLNSFINRYTNIGVTLLILFILSFALRIYIDRRILEKERLGN